MKNRLYSNAFIILFILTYSYNLYAEKVKPLNPDCEVCPVVISYDNNEAKNILGLDGMSRISKLGKIGNKTVKIDLDGIKKLGSEKDADEGYELIVNTNRNSIAINSIRDLSTITIKTDYQNLSIHGDMNRWAPEIELTPSHNIDKTDDLKFAWAKMKESRMYGYVNDGIDHREWNTKMNKFILNVLELITAD